MFSLELVLDLVWVLLVFACLNCNKCKQVKESEMVEEAKVKEAWDCFKYEVLELERKPNVKVWNYEEVVSESLGEKRDKVVYQLDMSIRELKRLASQLKIKGYGKMKKAELAERISLALAF